MIYGAFIINNRGQPRLTKYYTEVPMPKRDSVVQRIFSLVSTRPSSASNCVSFPGDLFGIESEEEDSCRLVFRQYATIYIVFAVDTCESELGMLEMIQLFVESLDGVFRNVSEVELIFHPERVHQVLDEIIMGGMVLESDKTRVLKSVQDAQSYESQTKKLSQEQARKTFAR
ncbi:MAG: hypothetical protein MHM6MM_005393 [Cercozoa sp. M6MM]